jgi:uncharacterized protein (TIGR03083 family)
MEGQNPMTTTPATEPDLMRTIAAERQDLADLLSELPDEAWDAPTLCAGWRVRELVAHVTMPFRYGAARFLAELARSGGRFHAMADRCARRDAARIPPAELLAALRDNVANAWRPPGGGLTGALTHDVVHGLDMTVPLGIARRVPLDRLRIVLAGTTDARAVKHFGTDLTGIELRADDLDWSFGSGQQVSGSAQDLLLVLCGRKVPPGRLHGEHARHFTSA